MKKEILTQLVTKRFVDTIAKFNEDLRAFAEECGEEEATLYEDICTSFTLSNLRIEGKYFVYQYDGREEKEILFRFCDDIKEGEEEAAFEEGLYFDWIEEIKEEIKFWRACFRRAKKYWAMSAEELDAKEEAYLYGEAEEEAEEEAANQEAEETKAAEEAAAEAEAAANRAANQANEAEYFAAKVTTAADMKAAAKYQEAAAVAADMAEYFADKAEAEAAKVTTAADAEVMKAAAVAFGFFGFYFTFAVFGI